MRTITPDELRQTLTDHRAWLERGRTGTGQADLTRAYLTGANLAGANLAGANLARADLARADLTRADLAGANLAGANLNGAYLSGAKSLAWVGPVGSGGRTIYGVLHADTIMAQAGCWWGSIDDLATRIAPGGDHGWPTAAEARYRAEYEAAIVWLRARLAVAS